MPKSETSFDDYLNDSSDESPNRNTDSQNYININGDKNGPTPINPQDNSPKTPTQKLIDFIPMKNHDNKPFYEIEDKESPIKGLDLLPLKDIERFKPLPTKDEIENGSSGIDKKLLDEYTSDLDSFEEPKIIDIPELNPSQKKKVTEIFLVEKYSCDDCLKEDFV